MYKLGLIGNPISHSFSKEYFNAKFKNKSINNFSYSLKKIEHIGGRRWNTYFKEGFFAKLPEKDYKIALRKLASMLSQYDIKTERLVFIDLRLLDRVSLKYKD